jgi:hypothetical protein
MSTLVSIPAGINITAYNIRSTGFCHSPRWSSRLASLLLLVSTTNQLFIVSTTMSLLMCNNSTIIPTHGVAQHIVIANQYIAFIVSISTIVIWQVLHLHYTYQSYLPVCICIILPHTSTTLVVTTYSTISLLSFLPS